MDNRVFHITADNWGSGSDPFSQFTVQVGNDPRRAVFNGDAYWQWFDASCLRNHGRNCSWTQALHDALVGWHACVLHTGDTLTVLPSHPDHARVAQLVDDVDAGRTLPSNPDPAPCAP